MGKGPAAPAIQAAAVAPTVSAVGGIRVEARPLAALVRYADNPRLHPPAQVEQIARSLRRFGWTYPILVDPDGEIIAGHGRLNAACLIRERGWTIPRWPDSHQAPVIVLAGLSEAQKRAYRIADNRLSESSVWDEALLAQEMEAISREFADLGDLGFSIEELERLVGGMAGEDGEAHQTSAVREYETGPVNDRFWISIRGPLADQAAVLDRLKAAMADLPAIEVDLGTVTAP